MDICRFLVYFLQLNMHPEYSSRGYFHKCKATFYLVFDLRDLKLKSIPIFFEIASTNSP